MDTPWKTDRWFVSPANYAAEVSQQFRFPPKIKIHDITLRDGEQQVGVVFTKEEKVQIAKKLAQAGIHRIEASMPAVSEQDEVAVKEIASLQLGPEIFAFARCMVADVEKAKECGVTGVIVEIPSSEHFIRHCYGWDLDRAKKLSIEATRCCKELGLYTCFFTIDATRAELNQFLDLVEEVASQGHMDALVLADTFGVCSPHAIAYLIRRIQERFDKPIEAHFHDDFGLAAINTITALSLGCSVAHTTVTTLGERAGNAPLEEVVLGLLLLYGLDLGIKTEMFCEISALVRRLARVEIRPNRSIVGPRLYQVESGIVAGFLRRCRQEHLLEAVPFLPELVGQPPVEITLGKNSGLPSIDEWLEKIGVQAAEGIRRQLVFKVKEKAFAKKDLLTEAEFRAIVAETLGSSHSD